MDKVFDKGHYDMLKAAQRRLHDLLPFVDKAEACGFECDTYRQAHKDFSAQLERIEQQFFTPAPRK